MTLRLLILPLLAAHLVFPLMWVMALVQDGPRQNDWRHFHIVAQQFVAGDWTNLYVGSPGSLHPGYLWRHPPYALYFVAPLAWLSPTCAYLVLASIEVAATAAALFLLARHAPPRTMTTEWVLAIVLSAPALAVVITGQISALIMLCVVAAAALWRSGRILPACALLGLLALKPNIGMFFGYYVIMRRQWRGAAVMMAVVAALCLATIPLGSGIWIDFLRASMSNVDMLALYEAYKLITLKAFLATVLGPGTLASVLWVVASILLLVAVAWAWKTPGPIITDFALAVLLTIAANVYGSFYDALLLAIPATVWWSERDRWRRGPWITVGVLIGIAWCWEQSAYTWNEILKLAGIEWVPPFSLVGPIAAIWLLLAAREKRYIESLRYVTNRSINGRARENLRA